MPQFDQDSLEGSTVEGKDGSKLGKVSGVFLDTETGKPEWVVVKTGMFGSKEALLPLAAASQTGATLTLPYSKDEVSQAPHHDPGDELSQQDEAELFTYYAVPSAGETVTSTGAPRIAQGAVGRDTSGPETDKAMTRSEEQLHVGTRSEETGRVRLRKYIVTENVIRTVPVSHEEVRIEREPITDGNRAAAMGGADISEEEHEVVLHGEQIVTSKETVPVERVRLGTETVTEDQQVSESVRKERIETDGDIDAR